jgi:hypothetical protein
VSLLGQRARRTMNHGRSVPLTATNNAIQLRDARVFTKILARRFSSARVSESFVFVGLPDWWLVETKGNEKVFWRSANSISASKLEGGPELLSCPRGQSRRKMKSVHLLLYGCRRGNTSALQAGSERAVCKEV